MPIPIFMTQTKSSPDQYADKTCGKDYFAYILAEDVNSGKATDYASVPVEIIIPQKDNGRSKDTKLFPVSFTADLYIIMKRKREVGSLERRFLH